MNLISERWASNEALNKALCEAKDKGQLVAFTESMFSVDPKTVRKVSAEEIAGSTRLSEAAKKSVKHLYEAKVAHYGKKNQNSRLYPRPVWQDQINNFTEKVGGQTRMESGLLTGAVDHLGYFEGGNLKSTCMLFRELWMEGDGVEGPVMGRFEIVEAHSVGKDLKANVDAGMAIGFSTYGYGTGHQPGDAERKEFGLSEDEYCAIMDRNYSLKKIDAVDDPSVVDARIKQQENRHPHGGPQKENTATPGGRDNPHERDTAMDPIKTLDDLKKQLPEVFRLHEAALETLQTQVKALTQEKGAAVALMTAVTSALNPALEGLSKVEGFKLPQREVLPAEQRQQLASLEQAKKDALDAKEKAEKEAKEAKQKVLDLEADETRRESIKKIVAKAKESLDGTSEEVRNLVVDDLKEKIKGDKDFKAEDVEAWVEKRCERYAKIRKVKPERRGSRRDDDEDREDRRGNRAPERRGKGGRSVDDDELDELDDDNVDFSESDDHEESSDLSEAFGGTNRRKPAGNRRKRDDDDDNE